MSMAGMVSPLTSETPPSAGLGGAPDTAGWIVLLDELHDSARVSTPHGQREVLARQINPFHD
jgi:hypothetical protein